MPVGTFSREELDALRALRFRLGNVTDGAAMPNHYTRRELVTHINRVGQELVTLAYEISAAEAAKQEQAQ